MKKKSKPKPSVRMLLARLGRTKEAVAKKLLKLDCRGEPDQGYRCPVAIYLDLQRGVRHTFVGVTYTRENLGSRHIPLTSAVEQFIRAFDDGEFLELRA